MATETLDGRPELSPAEREGALIEGLPVYLRPAQELYPVPLKRMIEELNRTEIGPGGDVANLVRNFDTARAFLLGAPYLSRVSPEQIDQPDYRQFVLEVERKFTTSEGSRERYDRGNLHGTLEETLIDPLVRYSLFQSGYSGDYGAWREDQITVAERTERQRLLYQLNSARIATGKLPILDRDLETEYPGATKLAKDASENSVLIEEEGLRRIENARPEIEALEAHLDAAMLVDQMFAQRQATAHLEILTARLAEQFRVGSLATPDKVHWESYFRGRPEFGLNISKSLRAMVDVAYGRVEGIDRWIYSDGFESPSFKGWLKHMLVIADGDIAAVWEARKLWHCFELGGEFDKKVEEDGKYEFGKPTEVGALASWMANPDAHLADEWGIDSKGQRIPGRSLKRKGYATHPMAIEPTDPRIGRILGSYLQESKVELDREYFTHSLHESDGTTLAQKIINGLTEDFGRAASSRERKLIQKKIDNIDSFIRGNDKKHVEVSLYDLWYHGGVELSDEAFPWASTEIEASSSEAPAGSVEGWFTKRFRVNEVLNDLLRKIPRPDEMTLEWFGSNVFRHADKLGLVAPGGLEKRKFTVFESGRAKVVEEDAPLNPMAWWLAGVLQYNNVEVFDSTANDGMRRFKTRDALGKIPKISFAMDKAAMVTNTMIIERARDAGLISGEEMMWLATEVVYVKQEEMQSWLTRYVVQERRNYWQNKIKRPRNTKI